MKSRIDQFVINRVREIRLKKGVSQDELADGLKMSTGFLGKVESPKYPSHYNLKHLNKIARILECSPQEFLPPKAI